MRSLYVIGNSYLMRGFSVSSLSAIATALFLLLVAHKPVAAQQSVLPYCVTGTTPQGAYVTAPCSATNPLPIVINNGGTLANAVTTMPADAVNYNNTTLTAGTVTNGLFSSGTVINPTTNQNLIGPIDTAGAASFAFQLTTTVSQSINFYESDSTTGPWQLVYGATNGSAGQSNFVSSIGSIGAIFSAPVKHRYLIVQTGSGSAATMTISGYLRSTPFVGTLQFPQNYETILSALPATVLAANAPYVPRMSSTGYKLVLPYSIPEATWQYSTAGTPITTATTTQLNAAGAANVRNYITSIQCDNTGALGTEVQILDGATVIWDRQIGAVASAQPGQLTLPSGGIPLRGSAATAISLKTVSGTTISLLCSVQGYQAY